ncbi:MAG TPA: CRTAC1 family protein [Bryobacteraceae bacterium]|nr:CRTAC1 family protein [Bryobacteraceae bacterium]
MKKSGGTSSKRLLASLAVSATWLLSATRPHYTDIAPDSAISYRTNNDFTGRKYFQQPICGGVGILDYDRDGRMDIFFTNGSKLPELKKTDASFHHCLLRNRGGGKFEDVTQRAGLAGETLDFSYGVAAGDYDNDGWPDLFVANTGRNALYHNNGNGTFADVTESSGLGAKPAGTLSIQAAWFDYDNDGLLDLVVSNYTLWTPQQDRRCRRGEQEVYCSPTTYASVPHRLYHNLGGGRFADVTDRSGLGKEPGKGMGIAIADFNQDGWMDVFIANDTERNFLYLNQHDGTFREAGLPWGVAYNDAAATVSAMGCDAKDYDNDGWPDIFYNDLMGQTWALFHNQRGRSFQYVSPIAKLARLSEHYSGWSGGFIDYNNDGWKDLFSANGDVDNLVPNAPQHDTMFENMGFENVGFENMGGREFRDVSSEMGAGFLRVGFQRGAAFADLNNDGFLDLVVTSLNQKPRILLNSADNGNHWLLFQAIGHRSSRDAVGARIQVTTPSGRRLYNHVTASVGFLSSSDLRVHFGLAGETSASTVEIRWPSGLVQTLRNVPADQIVKLEEPQTPTAGADR